MNSTLLWLANETLLLTNLFVITYKVSLRLLSGLFPPVVNPIFYSKELFAPEPFEIPLYLILSIIFVIIILSKSINFLTLRTSPKRGIFFLALFLSFYLNIGSYPMKNNIQFIENLVDPNTSVFILTAYIGAVSIIIVLAHRLRHRLILLFSLILIAIALFTFEPGFPSSNHDTSYFLGPIYEISQGKTIFTTTSSQYGFLSILMLAFMTKLNIFNPFYLPFLTWLLYILEYFLCFYIIYKSSRSAVLALIGLFSIVTINYFSLFHLPNTFPQIGPMRWLPLIIALFLVQRYKNLTNLKFIFFLSLLSLWNVEAGIALFLSYVFTLLLLASVNYVDKKRVFSSLACLAAGILIILMVLNVIHLLSGRQTIDFIGAFAKLREFAVAGIFMIPMPWRTHFWLVILIYFATIIYVFRKTAKISHNQQETKNKKYSNNKKSISKLFEKLKFGNWNLFGKLGSWDLEFEKVLLLFSANLSLFASVYFVGRSHPHNLFHISLFFLLNVFLLINEIIKNSIPKNISKKTLATFYLLLTTLLIIYPAYNRKQALATIIKTKFDRLNNGHIFKPELEQEVKQYYSTESLLIKRNLIDDEIIILSVDDTYLFYLSNKKNLLLDNPQSGIASKVDLKMALKRALNVCPQKIVATCSQFGLCPTYKTFNHELVNIQKVLLESLEKGCKIKYKPTSCTNKLCIISSI